MATNTYVALDTKTVTSAVSSITFTGINQTYTDLVVVANCKLTGGSGTAWFRVNGDSGSNYSDTFLYGNGSTATSVRHSNVAQAYFADAANSFQTYILSFNNYSNATTYKTTICRGSTAASGVAAVAALWRNTAAITSIEIGQNTTQWDVGSTFTLYGIRAEGVSPAVKATGGVIYSDSTYYYHAFPASGTFTPLQSLTADILVVAGGGGGANGGGGAGGLLAFSSQSLSATGYTVTVGGPGAGGTSGPTRGSNGGDSQFGALTLVKGGGGAGSGALTSGLTGGSGGGGSVPSGTGGSATTSQGYAGGTAGTASGYYAAAGGGGAGAVGANGNSAVGGGAGGIGSSTYSSWGLATGLGQNVSGTYYFAGGGGGGADSSKSGAGGYGGGGTGTSTSAGVAGLANTGGGGGGASNLSGTGAAGGSGIVIVRYTKA